MQGGVAQFLRGVMFLIVLFLFVGVQQKGMAQEETFEAYGSFFSTQPYDKNNYTNSAALREAMFVFDAIKSAILKRDLEAYKKHVTAEVLHWMDVQGLTLTNASPVDVVFAKGWEGTGVVLFNVVLKYKNKGDEERDPVFIKENGEWKMNAGIGLEK